MIVQGRSPRILVVDDDLSVIAAYRHVLEGDAHRRHVPARPAASLDEEELFGEDETSIADQMTWRVHFVDQGEDAVGAVKSSLKSGDRFRVVFLDVRMPPGMDGYETAGQLRQLDPDLHIVVVSAYSDYDEEDMLQVAGPAERFSFLPKPVWPDQLLAKARELCA